MTRVWNHSKQKRSRKLVLLAVADYCSNDDGSGAWPSQGSLASKTGLTDRQVRTILLDLEKSGELQVSPPELGRRTMTMTVSVWPEETSGVQPCPCYGCKGVERKKFPPSPEVITGQVGKNFRSPRKPASDNPVPIRPRNPQGTVSSEDGAAAPLSGGTNEDDVEYVVSAYLECGGDRTDYARFKVAKEAERLMRSHDREAVAAAARVLGISKRSPWELSEFVVADEA